MTKEVKGSVKAKEKAYNMEKISAKLENWEAFKN